MSRRFACHMLCLVVLGVLGLACERSITPKKLDEPCTRSGQCERGLVCLAGVCRPESEAPRDTDAGT